MESGSTAKNVHSLPALADDLEAHIRDLKDRLKSCGQGSVADFVCAELAAMRVAIVKLQEQQTLVLAQSHAANLLIQDYGRSPSCGVLAKSVCIEADQLFKPTDGFHSLEHVEGGLPYRWTGPGKTFRFAVFVDRATSLGFELVLLGTFTEDTLKSIQCHVCGVPVDVQIEHLGVHPVVTGVLPAVNAPVRTLLEFSVEKTISPASISSDNTDERKLGVMFHRLTVQENGPDSERERRFFSFGRIGGSEK